MKTIKLNVNGMHCPSCEILIKDSLEETNGIKNADISNEKGTAEVTFDEAKVNQDKIIEIIKNEGYKVE